MADYSALLADWQALLVRRAALAEPLRFWTAILESWAAWKPPATLIPLSWTVKECRERWAAGRPLLATAAPRIDRAAVEDLLGPVMERLAADGPETAAALRRLAEAWDAGLIDATALLPGLGRDPAARLQARFGLPSHLGGFLIPAGLRPPLETYFEGVRELPEGAWAGGGCPWCGGAPSYAELMAEERRRLSCHVCGGAWMAARLRCPFCDTWNSRDLVRLQVEGLEEGDVIEGCRGCRGYLKGVDRRLRPAPGRPLLEDWASPHLDVLAAREGFRRPTPSLAHLLPRDPETPA